MAMFRALRNTTFNILLPKSFVVALLASFYVLAYIISPYWLMPSTHAGIIVTLILTIIIGGIWSYFSADNLEIRINIWSGLTLLLLIAGIIALNFQSLRYDIPWRGDEDFHINKTLWVVDYISTKWIAIYFLVLVIFLYASWKMPKAAIVAGGVILVSLILAYTKPNLVPKMPDVFLRYPFVSYWFYSLIPSLIASKYPYHEILFRLIPVVCAGTIIWITLQQFTSAGFPLVLLGGVALATIPVLFYYSSILYLELPAILFMLVVALNIKNLFNDDFDQIRKTPAWYALILIGFIKETTISFLFCFLLCRLVIFFIKRKNAGVQNHREMKGTFAHYVSKELSIVLLTLLPLVFYLFLRTEIINTRSFFPNPWNLLNISVYPTLVRSFWEQFGIFFLLFIAGCVLLLIEREYIVASFYILTLLFIPLFHVMDSAAYTGYSRFNLFVLPTILVGASVAIKKLIENRKTIGLITVCIGIVINLWMSPVYVDGSKKSLWGNYFVDTSEHYYPYQEALTWLRKSYFDSHILFVNGDFSYGYEFYFNQLKWRPNCEFLENSSEKDSEIDTLSSVLVDARKRAFDVVVYQVIKQDTIPPKGLDGYQLEKVFINDAEEAIAIYTK